MFDFRAVDLLDRMDWNDPNLPAILQFFNKISHTVTMSNGVENFRSHIITVAGELTPKKTVDESASFISAN